MHLDPAVLAQIRANHPGKSLGAAFEAVWRTGGARIGEIGDPHDFQRSSTGLSTICSRCECSNKSIVGKLAVCPVPRTETTQKGPK